MNERARVFLPVERPSLWRKLAVATWDPPLDPSIYGTIDIEADNLLAWIVRERARTGERVTVTHAVVRALGVMLRDHPSLHCCVRRGKLYQRTSVDIFCQVAVPAEDEGAHVQAADLSGAKLMGVEDLDVADIARRLGQSATRIRKRDDPMLATTKRTMSWMPSWLARPVMRTTAWLADQAGLDLRRLGVPRDPFGSGMVSSVGGLGLSQGFAPLFPLGLCPFVIVVGAVEKRPVVRDDRVVVAPVLTLCATLDHRVIDGLQAAQMARSIRTLLTQPSLLEIAA